MQAILTKYLPADSGHKARIKAWGMMFAAVIDYDDRFPLEANHLNAAVELCDQCGFSDLASYIITGQLYDSDYVHVINHLQYELDKVKE